MDWLGRYRRGEREQVWHELRQRGDRVRDPDVAAEVQAVCDEMAVRARRNVETVVGRLREQGYRFHTNDDEQAPVEHKANVSGGGPYGIRVPDATAEGLFVGEVAMPFVAYLDRVFRDGGFPGPATGGWKVKQTLSAGLLPL